MRSLFLRLSLALLFLFSLSYETFASVLAIDYGSDWIKASLMKPGVPFDILLNKDSKRKIQSSVGWKKSDRLFGSDAYNIAGRFPLDSFSSLKYLLAAPPGSEFASYFTKISTADVLKTSRGTMALRRSDGTEWSVEELIGMQLAYVKGLAEDLAGEKVHDVILTVPSYYSQFERDAIADAVEIAGLRTLALINDGTAIAVNYAMTRSFPTPEYHVIYDAGASSIRATVVQFTSDGKGKSGSTQIQVVGVGYERGVGGTELDRRLREILIDEFIGKHKRDIRGDKKGMAKLWKEAGRVKAILSANSEAASTVESLAFDIDFRAKIRRATFEDACSDLKNRFAKPILTALDNAGLTLDNITSVILAGGSSRTPMIQTAVRKAVGEDKIAMNVNADEAAVLGAALHGASLSRQFKTKDIKVQDISVHDIQASYSAAPTPQVRTRTINTLIFPKGSKVGTRKTLTFKRTEDFSVRLEYKYPVAPGFPMDILEAHINGISEALANLTERGAIDPVVKATVALSDSGFVSVKEAYAFAEVKDDSLAGKLKGLFGGGAPESDDGSEVPDTSTTSTESPSAATPSDTPSSEKKLALKDANTIPLNITLSFSSTPPMTVAQKSASRERLRLIDYEEAGKQRKEEARNNLEGYLYRVRDLLDDDNQETPFRKCSQESERRAIAEKVTESIAWLHDKGDLAETSQFWNKRNAIEALERPIVHRYQEIEAFPQALNISQMWNWSTRLFLTEAYSNLTTEAAAGQPSKWTREELEGLEKALKEHETWLHVWVEKQKSVKMNEDPVIETTEMKARAKTLELHLQRLVKRKVPKVKKTASATAASDAEETLVAEPEGTPYSPPAQDIHDEL